MSPEFMVDRNLYLASRLLSRWRPASEGGTLYCWQTNLTVWDQKSKWLLHLEEATQDTTTFHYWSSHGIEWERGTIWPIGLSLPDNIPLVTTETPLSALQYLQEQNLYPMINVDTSKYPAYPWAPPAIPPTVGIQEFLA